MSALTPIAHAGDWLTNAAFILPAVLFLIWLGVTTIRERRADAGDENEE